MSVNSDMTNASVSRRTDDVSLSTMASSDNIDNNKNKQNNTELDTKISQEMGISGETGGGMSAVQEEQQEEAKQDKKSKGVLSKAQSAMGVAHTAHSAAMTFNLIMFLKTMMTGISTSVASAVNGVWGFIVGVWNGVTGVASTVGSAVAGFFGTSVSVVSSVSAAVGSAVCVGVSAAVVATSTMGAAVRDTMNVADCALNVSSITAGFTGDIDAQTEVNAKGLYSVYKEAGFSNVQIAGVLGNFHKESNIDPTSVEAIFNEPFSIGTRKQQAIDCNFDLSVYAPDAGYSYDYCAGVGLAGFTGPNNEQLRNFAESNHKNWYDLDVQIAFSIGQYASADWLNNTYKVTNYGNTNEATEAFMNGYERPAADAADLAGRQAYAAEWYTRMGEWAVDVTYANSVLAMANTAIGDGNNQAVSVGLHDCKSAQTYNNSSLAAAAVSYAYETKEQGMNNNGTELYKTVHDNVFPGDPYYQSCDRGVACAVRWSGYDDNYPAGAVGTQLDYCISSSKWTEVTNWDGNPDNLQPGDIIFEGDNSRGHTLLYVGNAIIKAKYPNADESYCLVSASFNERSPGCQQWYSSDSRRIFRNVEKESNSQYTNAGAAAN